MIRSPKEIFQSSPHIVAWSDFVNKQPAAFESGCHTAMQELLNDLPVDSPDPSRSWDKYNQLAGARKLVEILSRLHEPNKPPSRLKPDELNYNA